MQPAAPAATPDSPLLTLLALLRRLREAHGRPELAFMAVNESHGLAPYRQAALWMPDSGVVALSGVVQVEANVPYAQWLQRVSAHLAAQTGQVSRIVASDLPQADAGEWAHWLPAQGLCIPIKGTGGILLLAREVPWQDRDLALLGEWMDAWAHAWRVLAPTELWSWRRFGAGLRSHLLLTSGPGWWRQKALFWYAFIIASLFIPVRLTVLAPGELVPLNPAVIRAPFDGVVGGFLIKPNEMVRAGQGLFTFDEATLASRLEVARQAVATAEAEYRQLIQQAVSDPRFKAQLVAVVGKIEERRAEVEYYRGQLARARVVAPRAGIALFDDPSEWLGKPVATGERVMRIAAPDQMEVEAWLSVGDAIPLQAGDDAVLYLNSSPVDPVRAVIRYVAFDPVQRPDGSFAYRVRARLSESTSHRVGLKGTVRLSGEEVRLGYWILRRPLAYIRQLVGW